MSEFSSASDADEGLIKAAEASIRAMISALHQQNVPADVMVDAALHILATWQASSESSFTGAERERCVQELMEMLPSDIDQRHAASWLPDAHGG